MLPVLEIVRENQIDYLVYLDDDIEIKQNDLIEKLLFLLKKKYNMWGKS